MEISTACVLHHNKKGGQTMLRQCHWGFTTLLVAFSLVAIESQVRGQESSDTSADSSTAEDTANTDATEEADTSDADTQADVNLDADASAEADADASVQTNSDAASAEASSEQQTENGNQPSAGDSNQTTANESGAVPPPSNQNGNAASTAEQQTDAAASQQSSQRQAGSNRNQSNVRAGADNRRNATRQQEFRRGVKFGQANDRGLTINTVERNSWYYNSGFRRGDVIVSVHGRPVRNDADFYRVVVLQPGQRVPVIVLRGGQRETIYIEQDIVHAHHQETRQNTSGGAYFGVIFRSEARDAAVVKSVNPGSPAQEAGVQAGDIILALNGQEVLSYQDAIKVIRSMRPGDELEVVVERSRNEEQMVAVLDTQPNASTTTRRTDVNGERAEVDQSTDLEVDVNGVGRNDRGLDRDRSNNGQRDRALLPGRRN